MKKYLLHHHPNEEVRRAALRLVDALCIWERDTGRQNLVIIKDESGCEYRSISGAPVPAELSDGELLASYEKIVNED